MAQSDDMTAIPLENKNSENTAINNDAENETKQGFDIQLMMRRYFKIKNQLAREFLAETLGIFILIAFGCASVAQNVFSDNNNKSFLSVNLSFGFGVTLAAVTVGKVSGCHINPAVSFAFLITGRMSVLRFLIYSLGQLLGAFLGAFAVWLVYFDAIHKFNNTNKLGVDTAGIFATYPAPHLSAWNGYFDQLVSTSLLVIVVLAVSDKKNGEIPSGTTAIIVGLTVTIIGSSFGHNCGYAINPARDLGPRLFTSIAGWGSLPFTEGNYFFWIPIVGPMSGSILGVLLYSLFVSNNWP